MYRPKKTVQRIKSSDGLQKIGEQCGLHLLEKNIVTTEIEKQFYIEFAAMDSIFLNQLDTKMRTQVIERALELCRDIVVISSVDLKFEKV